jgi:hypothetical protein
MFNLLRRIVPKIKPKRDKLFPNVFPKDPDRRFSKDPSDLGKAFGTELFRYDFEFVIWCLFVIWVLSKGSFGLFVFYLQLKFLQESFDKYLWLGFVFLAVNTKK